MHSSNFKDITGQRFGRLTAIRYSHTGKENRAVWLCKCDCGRYVAVPGKSLRTGNTTSCGCLNIENSTERIVKFNTKHGKAHTRLFRVWASMMTRCNNPNATNYRDYGGRGIRVCEEWETDFNAFYTWAIENGYKDDAKRGIYTVDRIDNDKGYSPENCRLASSLEQANNRRSTHFITYKGETKGRAQWARHFGKSAGVFDKLTDDEAIERMDAYEEYKAIHGHYPRKLRNGYRRKL